MRQGSRVSGKVEHKDMVSGARRSFFFFLSVVLLLPQTEQEILLVEPQQAKRGKY